MKLSISNIAWSEEQNQAVYTLMQKYGYTGLEIAPSRVIPQNPYENLQTASEWVKELKNRTGFVISSIQSIWYGKNENIWGSAEERSSLIEYTEKAVAFANAIKCGHLVFGCPRNRNMPENIALLDQNSQKSSNGQNDQSKTEINTIINFFRKIGEHAAKHDVVIGLEANPKIYNTNFLNDTASAIDFIKTVDSSGIMLNLDVGTIIENDESLEVVEKNFSFIHHVHISEPYLNVIEERCDLHKALRRILDKHSYSGFVSIEMKKGSDLKTLESVMAYIASVFGD